MLLAASPLREARPLGALPRHPEEPAACFLCRAPWSPPHPLLARARGPEAPRPCHPRPTSTLSPFRDYMPRGRCGHYCPPTTWEEAEGSEASPATCRRSLAHRRGAELEAVPTGSMRPGRHSPASHRARASPSGEGGAGHTHVPVSHDPQGKTQGISRTRSHSSPGAPATVAKCACRQRRHPRRRRRPPFPGRTPTPGAVIGGTTPAPPTPLQTKTL